ncbi:GIY-YIG nuclease family protein [Tenacibaculum sp. MEBiC06402]|uniref:GIY-YIG nuclease family protein n=1 Tax=unclassified Tenacibaculum TaxID=2635139 RepID=UPI003B995A6F
MKTSHIYYVYILSNKIKGTLYIGMTNDLHRRIYEHKSKALKGFTRKYNIDKLMYYEEFNNVEQAILREKRLKKWNREWKIELIEENNKDWLDLAKDFYDEF